MRQIGKPSIPKEELQKIRMNRAGKEGKSRKGEGGLGSTETEIRGKGTME